MKPFNCQNSKPNFLKNDIVISIITALSPVRKYSGYIYHAV